MVFSDAVSLGFSTGSQSLSISSASDLRFSADGSVVVVVSAFVIGACSVGAVSFGACASGGRSSGVGGKILLCYNKMSITIVPDRRWNAVSYSTNSEERETHGTHSW